MQSDHSRLISIIPHPGRLRVLWNTRVVADTTEAVVLHEGAYAAVPYIPRTDVDMTLLRLASVTSRSPRIGEAYYFSFDADGARLENAIWSYETPFPDAAPIAGHLAFDARHFAFVENNTPG